MTSDIVRYRVAPGGASKRYEERFAMINGSRRLMMVVSCSDCGQEYCFQKPSIRSGTGREELEASCVRMLEDRLNRIGWTFKTGLRHPLCPTHSLTKEKKPMKTPSQPHTVVAVDKTPVKDGQVVTLAPAPVHSGTITPAAITPATPATSTPTRDQNRAIMDQLDKLYLIEKQRYIGTNSDATVATHLNYPRIWVGDIRTQFFGEHDRNEASDAAARLLANWDEALAEAKSLMDRAIELLSKAERDRDAFRREFKK